MSKKREYIKVSFQVIGFSLGIVFLCLIYRKADPMTIARVGAFTSVFFAFVRIMREKRSAYIIIYLLSLLVLAVVLVALKIKMVSLVSKFTMLLAAALWVPYFLIILAYRLPIKAIYKKALLGSLLSILPLLVFGRWGNAIQTMATISVDILLYCFIIKNATSKERWSCYGVFVLVFSLFLVLFGGVEYIAFPLLAYMFFLLVATLFSLYLFQGRKKWLTLVLLILISCPISYFGSLNSFYYLMAKRENHDIDLACPLSYCFVLNECDTLNENALRGKNVMVFFWSSHCANCHKEFPSFSELAAEYESDTTKVFIAAFIAFGEDGETAYYQDETERKYAFEWANAIDSQQIMKDLGFNSFPHLTIWDKTGQVVYNGLYINQKGVFVCNPRKYMDS